MNKVRQSPLVKKRIEEFLDQGIGACRSDSEIRNWHRNELLISFEKIPEEIETKILADFNSQQYDRNKVKIYNYLTANNMKLLFNSIEDF